VFVVIDWKPAVNEPADVVCSVASGKTILVPIVTMVPLIAAGVVWPIGEFSSDVSPVTVPPVTATAEAA
jgi:hypothetical protein